MSETEALASYIVQNQVEDTPMDVLHEGRRAIVNYIGCAAGGAAHWLRALPARTPSGPYAWKSEV